MQIGNHDLTFVQNGSLVEVRVTNSSTSEAEGTPVRFKLSSSGNRLAADFPGVSDTHFITNGPAHGGGDGTITNG